MKISFNNFQREYETHKEAIDSGFNRVLNSGRFILGPEVKNFEKSFAEYIGTNHSVGVANGMEALEIALMALNVGSGDEVITTPHSAVATALAIQAVGAKPVFVDIDEYYHLDADKILEKITDKTRAIIPVHIYGQPADMDKIMSIAKEKNIAVIEDCAQAHGATLANGKKVGSIGTLGCFSFYPTKNLGGCGDGGAITTNDATLNEKCLMLRNYGQKNRYEHEVCGLNSRLDEIQAVFLNDKLKRLDSDNARRYEIAKIYKKELAGVGDIVLPKERDGIKHVYHLFVIETSKRDALQEFLIEHEIDSLIHYPIPIHKQKCLSEYNNIFLPRIETATKRILSLPVHPYLTDEEVLFVCGTIKGFYS